MKKNNKIKLICFDLWKTLAYKDIKYNSLKLMLKETNSKITYKKFIKIYERSTQTKIWRTKKEAYTNLVQNMDIPKTEKNIKTLIKIRNDVEKHVQLFDYTIPMLKKLKKKYKLGLISNSNIFIIKKIKKNTELLKYIDYPLFSFIAKTIKPDLKIYQKMIEISKINPENILMIGDNYFDDVLPPRKLKINSIHLKNYEELKKELKKFNIII